MSNCNEAVTPLETRAKLKKESNDEFVNSTLYKQIIGFLRYLCNTRPDICQSVGLLSRFMEKPQECHSHRSKEGAEIHQGNYRPWRVIA